jgi:hypothetical protein
MLTLLHKVLLTGDSGSLLPLQNCWTTSLLTGFRKPPSKLLDNQSLDRIQEAPFETSLDRIQEASFKTSVQPFS